MTDSEAKIFYGAQVSKKNVLSFIKKNKHLLEDEDEELNNIDISEIFEAASGELEFNGVVIFDNEDSESDKYFIASYVASTFDFNMVEEINIPTQAELNKSWLKAKEHFNIKKKPKWYISSSLF